MLKHAPASSTLLRTLEQGDMSVGDYCRKMKSTADGLRDLGSTVSEHVLFLNVLRGLSVF
jgi:hypothetical protein